MIRVTVTVFIAVLLGAASCEPSLAPDKPGVAGLDDQFDHSTLVIEANDGRRHDFRIYLAERPEQQRQGLMFVRSLPDDVGMLFVYKGSAIHSIWMKNTYLPLDLVFATGDGKVSSVIHDTQPLSLESQSSIEPVSYVLELKAGTARKLNIGNKSRLIWSAHDN